MQQLRILELLPRPEEIVEESQVEANPATETSNLEIKFSSIPDGGLVDVLDVVAHVNSFLYTYIDVEHAAAAITIV